jgi:hypothetical protein
VVSSNSFVESEYPCNFHSAVIVASNDRLAILCNAMHPWIAFAGVGSGDLEPKAFVDPPTWAVKFAEIGIREAASPVGLSVVVGVVPVDLQNAEDLRLCVSIGAAPLMALWTLPVRGSIRAKASLPSRPARRASWMGSPKSRGTPGEPQVGHAEMMLTG